MPATFGRSCRDATHSTPFNPAPCEAALEGYPNGPADPLDPTNVGREAARCVEIVLVNLAVNARDAMDGEGHLTIRIWLASEVPPTRGHRGTLSGLVAVSMSDIGAGIDPEVMSRIFEPFFTTKEIGKGTGLGLSQVYGFAKQSGGELQVESEIGRGTTFTLNLPKAHAKPSAESATEAPRASRRDGTSGGPGGRGVGFLPPAAERGMSLDGLAIEAVAMPLRHTWRRARAWRPCRPPSGRRPNQESLDQWEIENISNYNPDVTMSENSLRTRIKIGVFVGLRDFAFNILKSNRRSSLSQNRFRFRAAIGGLDRLLNLLRIPER